MLGFILSYSQIQHTTRSCPFLYWGQKTALSVTITYIVIKLVGVVLVINGHLVSDSRRQRIIYKRFKLPIVVLGGKQMNIFTIENTTTNN